MTKVKYPAAAAGPEGLWPGGSCEALKIFKKTSSPLSKIPLNYGGDGGGLRWG